MNLPDNGAVQGMADTADWATALPVSHRGFGPQRNTATFLISIALVDDQKMPFYPGIQAVL